MRGRRCERVFVRLITGIKAQGPYMINFASFSEISPECPGLQDGLFYFHVSRYSVRVFIKAFTSQHDSEKDGELQALRLLLAEFIFRVNFPNECKLFAPFFLGGDNRVIGLGL